MNSVQHTLKSHIKTIVKLAVPVSLGQAGHVMTQIADSVMLGNYDALDLAASTLAFSLLVPFMLFGIGFTMCLNPVTSQGLGEKNSQKIAGFLKNSVALFFVAGVVLVGVLFLIKPLIYHIDQDPAILPLTDQYYSVVAFSIFFVVLNQIFRQFSDGLSFTTYPMYISLVGNTINIIGNYLLIYGVGDIPPMGAYGAALSTLFSRMLMTVMCFALLVFHKNYKEYVALAYKAKISIEKLKHLLNLGIPIGLQFIIEVAAFAIVVIFIGWLGADYLVAHNIAMNLATFTFMLSTGIGTATTIRVAYFYGEKSYSEMKKAATAGFICVLLWMSFSALILILGRFYFPTLYVSDGEIEIIQIASTLILLAGFFQLSDGVQLMSSNILRGVNDVKVPTIICLFSYWLISLPLGYSLAFYYGYSVKGIWLGLVLGLTCSAILLTLRLRSRLKYFKANW